MKIAFVTESVSRRAGGMFEVVRRSGQRLQQTGEADVEVYGLWDQDTENDRQLWQSLKVNAFARRGPAKFSLSPSLLTALATSGADVVHTHGLWQYPSIAAVAWARRTKRPRMVTPHGMLDEWAIRRSRFKKWVAGVAFEGSHLRKAACVQALSAQEAASVRTFGVRAPICVIPNGVDLPGPGGDVAPVGARNGSRPKRVLSLGRIHPKKGLPHLLHGWAAARADHAGVGADWVLTVAGWDQNGHEAELRALAHELGIEGSVEFPGPLFGAAKSEAFNCADAFILPSLSEGLPMAVLEAWAHRLPVLITPQCNLPEGYAADAAIRITSDSSGVSAGLSALWRLTDAERARIGDNGRSLVATRFTWDVTVRQLLSVYRWLVDGGQRPDTLYPR
jgi:poly(glycerol-phosphate) alpha-glucosyltransferase